MGGQVSSLLGKSFGPYVTLVGEWVSNREMFHGSTDVFFTGKLPATPTRAYVPTL